MRTAARCLEEIRAADPGTEITLHYIRKIIHTKQVPVVEVGRKKLVDVDAVLSYIESGPSAIREPVELTGGIRRVAV
jgi:hypothetical protein